jgi:hypothetical protein
VETTLDDDNWPSMERDVSFKLLLAPVELEWRTELSVRSDSISEKNPNRISLVAHWTGPSPIGSHCPLIDPAAPAEDKWLDKRSCGPPSGSAALHSI